MGRTDGDDIKSKAFEKCALDATIYHRVRQSLLLLRLEVLVKPICR